MNFTRFVVQYQGYHENGQLAEKEYLILNFDIPVVTIEDIKEGINKQGTLSKYRRNDKIFIHELKPF